MLTVSRFGDRKWIKKKTNNRPNFVDNLILDIPLKSNLVLLLCCVYYCHRENTWLAASSLLKSMATSLSPFIIGKVRSVGINSLLVLVPDTWEAV